ncbi:uncharacterized protein PHACADRAFT_150148 [Phanerochaete carnosa HHB-10118-sp]|uniref:2-dehydropantoate 2-reductase n=1 Tax=Phanerochaete carnosa (strain HHB-10118-sp) TaxID=650164 RepID=K5WMR5_PHACS|nr:uncharacterized protein PHACADRAFT_150148 [Phanerochaete carnosa HHB-10118-sp]EKM51612.1 hypothetical protein PHACADRAFT_150148 [Phanerochaete carnosa HHB-10118-sp]
MTVEICVVGFGAIGALYAFALERSSEVHLTAVCRSNHIAVRENGLIIESDKLGTHSPWHPYRVVRTVEEAADRPYAFVICAAKCLPDVGLTSSILEPLLKTLPSTPETAIVLLQNGVGIEEDVQKAIAGSGATNPVLSGCAWVDVTVVDGGKRVVQHGNERLVLGYHKPPQGYTSTDNRGPDALNKLCSLLQFAGASAQVASDVDAARWRKVLWNASFSTMCTLTRTTVGDVLALQESRQELKAIMLEVLTVAREIVTEEGAAILSDSVADAVIQSENPLSVFKPSMLVDLEAGRPMEVEVIVGGIVRKARAHSKSTPRLEMIYAALKVIQKGLINVRSSV